MLRVLRPAREVKREILLRWKGRSCCQCWGRYWWMVGPWRTAMYGWWAGWCCCRRWGGSVRWSRDGAGGWWCRYRCVRYPSHHGSHGDRGSMVEGAVARHSERLPSWVIRRLSLSGAQSVAGAASLELRWGAGALSERASPGWGPSSTRGRKKGKSGSGSRWKWWCLRRRCLGMPYFENGCGPRDWYCRRSCQDFAQP